MANAEGKKKKPIGKIILGIVIVFIVIGVIGSMGGKSDSSNSNSDSTSVSTKDTKSDSQQEEKKEPYTITDEAVDTSNSYDYKITGILTNNTDKTASYVSVKYNLFDADGNQIGSAMANTSDLAAGATWKFEASSLKDPSQVARYERVDVSGF